MKTFNFTVDGAYSLTVDEIWPDGDAPENPSVQDVIAKVKSDCSSVYELIREWNLDQDLTVDVNGWPVDL